MAVPKKKTSKTRTNRRYRTWVKKEQKRLSDALVLVPYGRGNELKPAHIYIDDGEDLRRRKNAKTKSVATTEGKTAKAEKPAKKKAAPKAAKTAKEDKTDSEA
jgi:hypothetical protein